MSPKPGKGSRTRSKHGCRTCRGRKVKCDELRPMCVMCSRLNLQCEYHEQTEPLHKRREGAGPIKKRQYTDWQPQWIESKVVMASESADPLPLPQPSAPSFLPVAPLSRESIGTADTDDVFCMSMNTEAPDCFPAPASEYSNLHPAEAGQPPENGDMLAARAADAIGLDFGSFVQDSFQHAEVLGGPMSASSFSYSTSGVVSDVDFLFFDDFNPAPTAPPPPQPSPLSPLPSQIFAMMSQTACYDDDNSHQTGEDDTDCDMAAPSPLVGLVLGTSTIVLNSFSSRSKLTKHDYEALLHFHQQVGFSIGSKSPSWSTHAILIKLSVHNAAILHLLLAASFGELHWRQTAAAGFSGHVVANTTNRTAAAGYLATKHYEAGEMALRELKSSKDNKNAELYHVTAIACFWLEYLIQRRHDTQSSSALLDSETNSLQEPQYQQHRRYATYAEFSETVGAHVRAYKLRRALTSREPASPALLPSGHSVADGDEEEEENGNSTLANTNDKSIQEKEAVGPTATRLLPSKYRSFLARLLSWLFWFDCQACFFGKGGGLARQLYGGCGGGGRRRHPRSQLGLFYETGRTTLLDFWTDYTPEEIADDNQNWPALQLINETWVAVHRLNLLWEVVHREEEDVSQEAPHHARSSSDSLTSIARDVKAFRAKYASVFRLAAFPTKGGNNSHNNGSIGVGSGCSVHHRSRLLATADWALCNYLALELHLLRAGCPFDALYDDDDEDRYEDDSDGVCFDGAAIGAVEANFGQQPPPPRCGPRFNTSTYPQEAARRIVDAAERAIRAVGPLELDRFQWPLFWAGLATDNRVYRYFVATNLINADFRAALQAVMNDEDAQQADPKRGGGRVSLVRLRQICRDAGRASGGAMG